MYFKAKNQGWRTGSTGPSSATGESFLRDSFWLLKSTLQFITMLPAKHECVQKKQSPSRGCTASLVPLMLWCRCWKQPNCHRLFLEPFMPEGRKEHNKQVVRQVPWKKPRHQEEKHTIILGSTSTAPHHIAPENSRTLANPLITARLTQQFLCNWPTISSIS